MVRVGDTAILFVIFARANPLIGLAAIAPARHRVVVGKNRAWRDMAMFSRFHRVRGIRDEAREPRDDKFIAEKPPTAGTYRPARRKEARSVWMMTIVAR